MSTEPGSNQEPLGPKSDALTTAPLRHLNLYCVDYIIGKTLRGPKRQNIRNAYRPAYTILEAHLLNDRYPDSMFVLFLISVVRSPAYK